ncbi:unnamed protein product [Citrullus colocynthis]|uniref:Macrophage migration inhibitory factor n=1 Tax=Citrullus colocynthis TaxID=252529 RepID=A0ABP0YLA1_9ROSI
MWGPKRLKRETRAYAILQIRVSEEEEEEGEEGEEKKKKKKKKKKNMPCLNISTNVNLEGIDTSSVLSEASSTVAKIIGKPEAYVMVVLKGSVPMSFGGNEEPAAYGELVSIGGLNPDVNKKLSAAISAILETKLSVPKSRFFLKFYDTKGSNFGWNGSTF